ncbi:MAG: hypothetical protein HYT30_01555 [Parcubacteria group bacterium]|nr:hypothetical protein [Parcubacteria group bacterium]
MVKAGKHRSNQEMKKMFLLALCALCGTTALAEGSVSLRDITLVECEPVPSLDGLRVQQFFAPAKEECNNSASTVLIRVAEYGKVNALCSYRGGGRACTPLPAMNSAEHELFESMRAFAIPAKVYRTCTIGDGKTWLMEMVTPSGDCTPDIHAMRYWDFIQKRVYLKDGSKGIGYVDVPEVQAAR